MQLTFKQLKNLPVYTRSNDYLGRLKEIEINSETQNINRYIVKSSQLIKRLAGEELIINPSQVISIDSQKAIVEDNVIKNDNLVKEAVTV